MYLLDISISTCAVGAVEHGFCVHDWRWLGFLMYWLLGVVIRLPFQWLIHFGKASVIFIDVCVSPSAICKVVARVAITHELHFSALGSNHLLRSCKSTLPWLIHCCVCLME